MITNKIYKIKGMHCASCASIIERTIKKIDGVEDISVNTGTENAKIFFDETKANPDQFNQKLEPLGYSIVVSQVNDMKNISASEMDMSSDEHAAHLGLNQFPLRQDYGGQAKKEKLAELKDMRNKLLSLIPVVLISIFVMSFDILAQFKIVAKMSDFWSEFFHHLLPVL